MTEVLHHSESHKGHLALSSPLLANYIAEAPPPFEQVRLGHMEHYINEAQIREPELAKWLLDTGTDGLHATQSGSLLSILEHGLLPQSELGQLNHPVTSLEFRSLPEKRPTVHMVHWLYADSTVPYAEQPIEPITPSNFHEAILNEEQLRWHEGLNHMGATHIRNRHLTAVALRNYLASPSADNEHIDLLHANFPVIFGIRSDFLDEKRLTVAKRSHVAGDIQYGGSIEPDALPCLFVPDTYRALVAEKTDKPVFALETLRSMTSGFHIS